MVPTVPLPRRPLGPDDPVRHWYENELGWTAVPGPPLRLVTGLRFDVLEVPAEAGYAALRHLGPTSPVALRGGRMLLLAAAGSADELPGLLDWLEWGDLPLDLTAIGAGGSIEAPAPPWGADGPPAGCTAGPSPGPGTGASAAPAEERTAGAVTRPAPGAGTRLGSRRAAVWLRPPEPGCEVEPALPTLSALGGRAVGGGGGGAPDLVRLVDTMATHCHRVRLRRACAQPLAFS
ncbi:SCO3374 family protein [Streptomyces sp. Tue6028]|uniref:SCO3374 family protein n=1 Tax=Streptomyces sp. Tue6028 TaxID=2036037 RepID=UPI003D707100